MPAARQKQGATPSTASSLLIANLETRRVIGSYDRRTDRDEPCCAAIAGADDVLAAGLIRGELQAHLAVARVAEQPRSSTRASLLVRTTSSHRASLPLLQDATALRSALAA
jgi:hypothetical protein